MHGLHVKWPHENFVKRFHALELPNFGERPAIAMSIYDDIGNAQSHIIRALHSWWLDHARSDIPDRSELHPEDVKPLLPYLLISDVEYNPFRIRYRLVGTKVVEATGIDFTGRYLDELLPSDEDEPWMDDYAAAYHGRCPVAGRTVISVRSGVRFVYEFGIFPLRRGGSVIDQFVAVEDYFEFSYLFSALPEWQAIHPVHGTAMSRISATAIVSHETENSRRAANAR
jgi:hypothetical protein